MPAKSKAQQRFMGMVHACQKDSSDCASSEVEKVASDIKPSDAEEFASTKHKGLPEKKPKKEDIDMSEELDRIKKLAGVKEPVAEKIELNASDNDQKDARAGDVTQAMQMAKLKRKMEDRDGDDANFKGLFTGVARGEISLDDKGKIAEATFGIIKELEEACGKKHKKKAEESVEEELEEGSEEKKAGRKAAGSYGRPGSKYQKRVASKDSRKKGKKASKELDEHIYHEDVTSSMFPKDSLERIMVEMIVDEMKSGKNAEEISEELAFSLEHVEPIYDILKKKVFETAESLRPRGAPYIENDRFWGLPKSHLEYIMKDAHKASIAMRDHNPEAEGKYLDQINDASSVIGWREKHNLPYPEQGKFEEDGLPGYDAWKTASPYDDEPSQGDQDRAYDYAIEYGEDYLTTDKMAKAYISDIKNPKTDQEDRDGYVSDLASDVEGTITRNLENDGMLYLSDEEIRDMAVKLVSKHLSK